MNKFYYSFKKNRTYKIEEKHNLKKKKIKMKKNNYNNNLLQKKQKQNKE